MSFFPTELATPEAAPGLPIEWEEANCLLCGGRHWTPLIEAPDVIGSNTGLWFAVVQCQDCGLCFTNPRPSPASIGQFYPAVYRPHRSCVKRLADSARVRAAWFPRRRERQVLAWHGQGRLLDFGCGSGGFLELMSAHGWEVTGLDISEAAVQRVQNDLGLRARVGTLPHPDLEPEAFDVITMWHSLEHVHSPRDVLREAYQLLVPGGRLVVATPNIDSLAFRWFGRHWFGLDLPRHLTHFTPWTLPLMLERTGFRPGPVRLVRHSDWMRASARLACADRRSPYWVRWLTSKPVSSLATWYGHLTWQSDCMMVTGYK